MDTRPYLYPRDALVRVLVNTLILSLTIVVIGCVLFLAKETRYLLSATDRATQEEVQQYLGHKSFKRGLHEKAEAKARPSSFGSLKTVLLLLKG